MSFTKALLIIDMIDVYIYGERPLIPVETRERIITNINKTIKLARKRNVPVLYLNSAFRINDPIYKLINYREQAVEKLSEPRIIKELASKPGDYIIKKRGFDSFWKSGLEKLLKRLRVKELYLAGCQTDCCVRETAVTASHLGYDVYVLEDCCQTSREFGQIAALRFFSICTKAVIDVKDLQKKYFA